MIRILKFDLLRAGIMPRSINAIFSLFRKYRIPKINKRNSEINKMYRNPLLVFEGVSPTVIDKQGAVFLEKSTSFFGRNRNVWKFICAGTLLLMLWFVFQYYNWKKLEKKIKSEPKV